MSSITLPSYIEKSRIHKDRIFGRWIPVKQTEWISSYGTNHIKIVTYNRKLEKNDRICRCFFATIGISLLCCCCSKTWHETIFKPGCSGKEVEKEIFMTSIPTEWVNTEDYKSIQAYLTIEGHKTISYLDHSFLPYENGYIFMPYRKKEKAQYIECMPTAETWDEVIAQAKGTCAAYSGKMVFAPPQGKQFYTGSPRSPGKSKSNEGRPLLSPKKKSPRPNGSRSTRSPLSYGSSDIRNKGEIPLYGRG